MQAVILAAGKGTHLKPFTDTVPKSLIDVCGKPLLEHTFSVLPDNVEEILLVVGYFQEQIMEYFGSEWKGIPIRYVIQEELLGTGAATHLVRDLVRGSFLVMNGDDLYAKSDLERLAGEALGILLTQTKNPTVNAALLDDQGNFVGLETGAPDQEIKWKVCGAYVLDERFFRYPLAEISVGDHKEFGLPQTLIPMSEDCRISAVEATFWLPVGTNEQLEQARRQCK